MWIKRVEISDYRLFDRLSVSFGPGLNIIHGPNESGKSTLVHAIKTGLTLRSRVTGRHLERIRRRGGSAPEVVIEFVRGKTLYQVKKRFAGQQGTTRLACRSEGGATEVLTGTEAEERLQVVLGLAAVARARKKTDHLGIWPLVWLEQGRSPLAPAEDLNSDARDLLSTHLERLSGTVLSGSGGRELERAVDREYARFFTPSGRQATSANAPLVVARNEHCEAQKRLEALEQQARGYEEDIREYVRLTGEIDRLERELPATRRALAENELTLARVEKLEGKRKDIEARIHLMELEQKQVLERLDVRQKLEERIQEAEEEARGARAKLEESRRALAEHRASRRALREDVVRLETLVEKEKSRCAAVRARLDLLENQASLARVRKNLEQARGYHDRKLELEVLLTRNRISSEAVERLEALQEQAHKARVALESAAAGVHLRALRPVRVARVGEAPATMEAGETREVHVVEPTTFVVEDLLEVEVVPGGKDLAMLTRRVDEAEKALREALAAHDVASVQGARSRLERVRDLERELESHDKLLHVVAPEGLEPLRQQEIEFEQAVQEARERFKQRLDPGDSPLPDERGMLERLEQDLSGRLGELERELEKARARLNDHQIVEARLEHAVQLAGQKEENARAAAASARKDLEENQRRHGSDEEVRAVLAEVGRGLEQARGELVGVEREIAAQEPERAQLDAERLKRAVAQLEQELRTKEGRRKLLEGATTSVDLVGLHERVDRARAELEETRRKVARYESRARAVALLRETLGRCREATRQTYMGPLKRRLQPMLQLLFPEAELELGEGFEFEVVRRGGEAFSFDELSMGTREQLAVTTRLAMAQVLAGEEDTLCVVLDDALTASDDDRFASMASVLTLAGKTLQILLFTWDWTRYKSLAVPDQCVDLAVHSPGGA